MSVCEEITFQLIEIKNVAEEDCFPGLLHDYWQFDSSKATGYRYNIAELLRKYNIKYSHRLEKIVKANGHLLLFDVKRACNSCVDNIEVKSRKDFFVVAGNTYINNLDKKSVGFCLDCYITSIKDEIQDSFNILIQEISFVEVSARFVDDNDLSYLERIFLISLMAYEGVMENSTFAIAWNNFYEHEARGAEAIVQGLISKGFLKISSNAQQVEDEIFKIRTNLKYEHEVLGEEYTLECLHKLEHLKLPEPALCIPSGYLSLRSFFLSLLGKVKDARLSLNDINEVTNYVVNKRISELDSLYLFICNEKRIPVSNTAKKILVLKKISENLNLRESMNLISYSARLMQADLYHSLRHNIAPHNANIFINKLESRIDRIINYPDQVTVYSQSLPSNWYVTQTETIISLEVLDISDSWEILTTKQILDIWLNKVITE